MEQAIKKIKKVRTTKKQAVLAEKLVEESKNPRFITLKALLEESGYDMEGRRDPGQIIARPGVQKELIRLGFNEEAAKARVAEVLLNGEDHDALRAGEMVFKVFGTFAPVKSVNLNVFATTLQEIASEDKGIVQIKHD